MRRAASDTVHSHCLNLESTSSFRNRFLQLRGRVCVLTWGAYRRTVSDPLKTAATAKTAVGLLVAKRPQIQRPAGYATDSRKKLVIVKRSHSACVVFQHCEAMNEAEERRLWPRETNWGAHARRSVHLQFHEMPPPTTPTSSMR